VSLDEDNCPYCGVYLHGEENETSGYSLFASHLSEYRQNLSTLTSEAQDTEEEPEEEPSLESWRLFKALSLSVVGVNLAFLGFLLLCFGQGGHFTLQWDTSYWYVYFLAACPLLYCAWQALNALEKQS
jgi:hypothetical protein